VTNRKLAAALLSSLSLSLISACTRNHYSTDAASSSSGSGPSSSSSGSSSGSGGAGAQVLTTTLGSGASVNAVTINQGTAIGQGSLNGATPFSLTNLAADPRNTQNTSNPFLSSGTVPDTAYDFCTYPGGGASARLSYVTGAKFATMAAAPLGTTPVTGQDPSVAMAPYYFPLVYNTTLTGAYVNGVEQAGSGNAYGGQAPIIGLFDWRPKDIDEALVAAESDDNGKTWYFMQTVLELYPDRTNPISGGYSSSSTSTGCPATLQGTNTNATATGEYPAKIGYPASGADDGWGHAAIIQLPGSGNARTGQFLYMLDRNPNNLPGVTPATAIVDGAPLWVINLSSASNKFPIANTNNSTSSVPGTNDIKSIASALSPVSGNTTNPVVVRQTKGLLNPDGIMAVFPTPAANAVAATTPGAPITVLYVQKILNGDDTGSTAMQAAQQCNKAPFSGKTNHDISYVRLATTTDGINFTDQGIVTGLNDPATVDYTRTRWISPRGTLIDIYGNQTRWGLYFSGGNCLDGDSDAFHYIGYAESTDMRNWTVYNGITNPIASINSFTGPNQAGGASVTVPSTAPVIPTQTWFAQRLYAPTATQVDPTHLSMTFAGYGVQTPNNNLLNYRQIGNVELTVSIAGGGTLPAGTPNNINAH